MACGIRHAKLPSETCSPTSKATTIASGFTLPSATSPRNKPSVKPRNPVSTSSGEGQVELAHAGNHRRAADQRQQPSRSDEGLPVEGVTELPGQHHGGEHQGGPGPHLD